ncbi:MAG: LCP family protein [Patescibacteria group bacterium]
MQIDLNKNLKEEASSQKRPSKLKSIIKISVYFTVFSLIGFFVFLSQTPTSDQGSGSWLDRLPIIGQIKHLAESADKELKGEKNDRTNILLLGMGGRAHEGGYLTDTIMLASLEYSTKKIALLSIPRDLTIPIEDPGSFKLSGSSWRKINTINAYAEMAKSGSGGLAISQALSDVIGQPIDYFVRLDFEGFTNIIDELGGVKIDVENTLEDYSYPIMGMEEAEPYGARFEHLYIGKGEQEMDGNLALKYVRSRHASGIEGSDFARAKRQQKVIQATKDKLLSKFIIFKPRLITNIINELEKHLSTNLKIWEIIKLWDTFKNTEPNNIINKVLDNSRNGLLIDIITQEGAYILTPRSGDFAEIQYLANNIFSDVSQEYKSKVTIEKASLEIRNGTWINGLASQTALDLEKYGFEIIRTGNSSQQNFQKSVIYDLTYGEKIKSLTILKEKTNANVSFALPQWLMDDIGDEIKEEINPEMPDFILILGQDADKTGSGVENAEE